MSALPRTRHGTHDDGSTHERIDGVVIGVVAPGPDDTLRVTLPIRGMEGPWAARAAGDTSGLCPGDEVCVAFEEGDASRPIVLGRIVARPERASTPRADDKTPKTLRLEADEQILLRCGKATLTLSRDGKVVARGSAILTRSSGPNRIKGASVQIN